MKREVLNTLLDILLSERGESSFFYILKIREHIDVMIEV